MRILRVIADSLTAFFKDECFYLAASIAYFLIVALVPLSLLLIALFGYMLGGNEELYQFLLARLIDFFPSVTSGITNELKNLITYKGISLISSVIYGFLALQLFYSVEHAMNIIFKVPKKRHFLLSLFWTVFIVTLVIFFWLLSFTVSSFAGIVRQYPMNIFGLGLSFKAAIFLKYVAPFALVLMTFTAVYKIVPHVKVHTRHALAGALLVTVLWELAKHIFTMAVRNIGYIGTIYGSLTTFILFLLWMYYLSCIFLIGGEFVNSLRRKVQ
ncbi:MAG: YihY/virulence factor BrkB family protein [Nitrospira sp.]|nr:YihY/virulence factor BrkB family protein [bacterium]MBL7050342.1 YihY/virulence factor BrkB family protein [Nitrospira sp.]